MPTYKDGFNTPHDLSPDDFRAWGDHEIGRRIMAALGIREKDDDGSINERLDAESHMRRITSEDRGFSSDGVRTPASPLRTLFGLSKDTGIPQDVILSYIKRHPEEIVEHDVHLGGRTLYRIADQRRLPVG